MFAYFSISISLRIWPTCVNVVASAMTKGTLTNRASVFASNVFPVAQYVG